MSVAGPLPNREPEETRREIEKGDLFAGTENLPKSERGERETRDREGGGGGGDMSKGNQEEGRKDLAEGEERDETETGVTPKNHDEEEKFSRKRRGGGEGQALGITRGEA